MVAAVMLVLFFTVFIPNINCLRHKDGLASWAKQDTLPKSYFNVSVPNVLRCGKFCERQGLCVAVSFDGVERTCYLHEKPLEPVSTTNKGKYLFRNIRENPNATGSTYKCNSTQLSVPTAGGSGETCLNLQLYREEDDAKPNATSASMTYVNPCKNNQTFNGTDCICQAPLTGQFCEIGPRDCSDNFLLHVSADVYPEDDLGKVRIYCLGQLLIAFAAPKFGFTAESLNGSWAMFKRGFGQSPGNSGTVGNGYWLGNDNLHRITNGTLEYKLVLVAAYDQWIFNAGYYTYFRVDNETNNYTIHFNRYTRNSNVTQTLWSGRPFRTFDKNDDGCAVLMNTGFWFENGCPDEPMLLGALRVENINIQYNKLFAGLLRL